MSSVHFIYPQSSFFLIAFHIGSYIALQPDYNSNTRVAGLYQHVSGSFFSPIRPRNTHFTSLRAWIVFKNGVGAVVKRLRMTRRGEYRSWRRREQFSSFRSHWPTIISHLISSYSKQYKSIIYIILYTSYAVFATRSQINQKLFPQGQSNLYRSHEVSVNFKSNLWANFFSKILRINILFPPIREEACGGCAQDLSLNAGEG